MNGLVGSAYFVTGVAGLRLAFVAHAVTLFWPPSGLAFAAIWMGGLRLTPGIAVGAFLVNVYALRAPPFAALVAVGNTLPAIVGSMILRDMLAKQSAKRTRPGEFWRVQWFILVAALGSTMLSATIGALAVTALDPGAASIQSTWLVWWLGDAMGVLIVAPPLLLWDRVLVGQVRLGRLFEAVLLLVACFALIFGLLYIRNPVWAVELCKLFTLLLSLWAGTRFGLAGPAAVTLLMAAGGVAATWLGVGPFSRNSFYDSFALLHSYLFAEAIAGMLLAAALADLRRTLAAEKRARDAAEAAAANRVRMLMAISHDVRTPLSGMIGVLQTLDNRALTAGNQDLVALGLRAGSTLTRLVSDILDVARGDAGRIVLQHAPFDPRRSMTDVITILHDQSTAKGLALTLTGLDSLPHGVLGDRARFEQVLANLVGNAITYTKQGGITVHAGWLGSETGRLIFEVADTGPGIAADAVADLFDAFVLQPDSRSPGLGLGLHICRNLVSLMGGTIGYRPVAGGGSSFRVDLPLAQVPVPCAEPAGSTTERPWHVLLVQDDAIGQIVTRALLESHGHHVTVAGDADAAVNAAACGQFDLVLMDIVLGHGKDSGMVAARRIRALPGSAAKTPIIALTADASADSHRQYAHSGIDGVMIKPFALDTGLDAKIRAARWPAAPALDDGALA